MILRLDHPHCLPPLVCLDRVRTGTLGMLEFRIAPAKQAGFVYLDACRCIPYTPKPRMCWCVRLTCYKDPDSCRLQVKARRWQDSTLALRPHQTPGLRMQVHVLTNLSAYASLPQVSEPGIWFKIVIWVPSAYCQCIIQGHIVDATLLGSRREAEIGHHGRVGRTSRIAHLDSIP